MRSASGRPDNQLAEGESGFNTKLNDGKPWPMPQPKCRKCGGLMADGVAMVDTPIGGPDDLGGDVVTLSPGGPGKLVPCLKCAACGWSVTAKGL